MKTSGTIAEELEARVVVGHSPEPQSAFLRFWSQRGKSDVYASVRNIAGKIKISLHESGECNAGLTDQFAKNELEAVAAIGGSRHQSKWRRKTHVGSLIVTPLQFAIPFSQLKVWKNDTGTEKRITWINPPEPNHSIIISCIFSGQALSDDKWPGRNNGTNLIVSNILPNGEKFWLVWQDCPTSALVHEILAEAKVHMKQQKMVCFSEIIADSPPPIRQLIFREFQEDNLLVILDALYTEP